MADFTKVQTGKVFVLNKGAISEVEDTGSFEFNTDVLTTAGPRSRVPTIEVLSDEPSAVVSGVEKGAEKTVTAFPATGGLTGRIAPVAGYVGMVNDTVNVGQHVLQGNGAEAVTEATGVAGAAGGAWIGAEGMAATGTFLFGPGLGTVSGALVGGLAGAFVGAQDAKSLGTYLTGGDTPDKMGPPLTLPAGTPLEPTIITADGDRYALVQVDGNYTWFAMLDNSSLNLSSPYIEVVSGAKMAELTGAYLEASDFPAQLAEYSAALAESQRQQLQDAFAKSEIEYANSIGPDGRSWGTPTPINTNATQTWTPSPQSGQVLTRARRTTAATCAQLEGSIDSRAA